MKVNYGFPYFTFMVHNKILKMVSLGINEYFLNPYSNYGKFAIIRNQAKELVTGSIQNLIYAIADKEKLRSQFVTLNKARDQHRKYLSFVFAAQDAAIEHSLKIASII